MFSEFRMARYVISVAARLLGVTPGALRSYERAGLVRPARTNGHTRLYSDADLELLRRVIQFQQRGVNLAGIVVILEMEGIAAQLTEGTEKRKEG